MSKDAPENYSDDLRDMLRRLYPEPERFKEARQAVWDWWQLDHQVGTPA
jgi:hypothetical protein